MSVLFLHKFLQRICRRDNNLESHEMFVLIRHTTFEAKKVTHMLTDKILNKFIFMSKLLQLYFSLSSSHLVWSADDL